MQDDAVDVLVVVSQEFVVPLRTKEGFSEEAFNALTEALVSFAPGDLSARAGVAIGSPANQG